MKPTVYLETTIIGYLAMRMSAAPRTAANQQMARDWWDNYRDQYEVLVSQFVIDECSAGDPVAARDRLAFLQGLPQLEITEEVNVLAEALIVGFALPTKATVDAFHVSVAAVNGVEYLLTWNCRHIANAALRPRIEKVCRGLGYEPPVICTPLELMEIEDAI
ncbi:MAG: type II toxin-antitoxin system VapC family toxin [Pirellulaceae bacterium]